MKILIIGGTGNISTGITRLLLERGEDLTLYNRGSAASEFGNACRVIHGDRYDHAAFAAQMSDTGRFDCVIDMINYHPLDAETLVSIFSGRTAQVIFCSTVDVYTKRATAYPQREDAERKALPTFQYAHNKVQCENILLNAAEKNAFALTILRPAATHQDSSTPIATLGSGTGLLQRMRLGKPLLLPGDGTSLWVSSHRDDVAVPFANAAGNPVAFGKAYNVTGDEWMTWERYYEIPARVMGAPRPEFLPIPTDLLGAMLPESALWTLENFHFNNLFDNSAAKTDLGYQYRIHWETLCQRMIAWHDARGLIDNAAPQPLYDRVVTAWQRKRSELITEFADVN